MGKGKRHHQSHIAFNACKTRGVKRSTTFSWFFLLSIVLVASFTITKCPDYPLVYFPYSPLLSTLRLTTASIFAPAYCGLPVLASLFPLLKPLRPLHLHPSLLSSHFSRPPAGVRAASTMSKGLLRHVISALLP